MVPKITMDWNSTLSDYQWPIAIIPPITFCVFEAVLLFPVQELC